MGGVLQGRYIYDEINMNNLVCIKAILILSLVFINLKTVMSCLNKLQKY